MDIEIRKIVVNKMPHNCGECPLMIYLHDTQPVCIVIEQEYWEITGSPNDMTYRRSDCKLIVGGQEDV